MNHGMEQLGQKLDINTTEFIGGDGATNTSAIASGGDVPHNVHSNTEFWDGTSWTEVSRFSYSKKSLGDAGNATAALA
jgi:hypothetical protein